MANETVATKSTKPATATQSNGAGVPAIKRERRVYDHELSDKERVALRAVLAAKSTLAQVAVAIQEGKGVNVEFYKLCIELQKEAGFTLFGV